MNQYTQLENCSNYLNDLDSSGAVQFKEVRQQQYFSKTSKVMQCRQFLNKELMSELYVRTNLILDILENQSNINSFGTNTVECEFGLTKNLCNGKQTPQVMKGVISRQLKQKAAFYQNNNDQYPIQTMSRSIQQSLSMQAIFIYDSISNNARTLLIHRNWLTCQIIQMKNTSFPRFYYQTTTIYVKRQMIRIVQQAQRNKANYQRQLNLVNLSIIFILRL
ncbi:Hypothetical_protein [Hexamita inflata]|uniref:Hypothetical_protein n=1 Tax=Hexamita inflata TaxID=28002 RepID=A0AA86N7S9_9EUKA|nr:Hypothetical protein HINF_LOCUS1973 [Hexamita inflata]